MKRWNCNCENVLFFDAVRCVNCSGRTGMCPACSTVSLLVPDGQNRFRCGNSECGTPLRLCNNYHTHAVCNRCTLVNCESTSPLCNYCYLNRVIPDLTIEGNHDKWRKLEAAKRRALFGLEMAGFVLENSDESSASPLRFEFKDGSIPTGHADGCITINLREADDVERERIRVKFGEPQRSLIGHFRHELGHYFWDKLVNPTHLTEFRKLFGNEEEPSYAQAHKRYYENGPKPGWPSQFVSAYASMHPWEDFAETFGVYLDMHAILATSEHFGMAVGNSHTLDEMTAEYKHIGVLVNELNRDIGLPDLVPEVFTKAIVEKLRFVHGLSQFS